MVDQEGLVVDWLRHSAPNREESSQGSILRFPVALPHYLRSWLKTSKYSHLQDLIDAHPEYFTQRSDGSYLVLQGRILDQSKPTLMTVPPPPDVPQQFNSTVIKIIQNVNDQTVLEGVTRYLRASISVNLDTINNLLAQKLGKHRAPNLQDFIYRYPDVFTLINGVITLIPEFRAISNVEFRATALMDDIAVIYSLTQEFKYPTMPLPDIERAMAKIMPKETLNNYIKKFPTLFQVDMAGMNVTMRRLETVEKAVKIVKSVFASKKVKQMSLSYIEANLPAPLKSSIIVFYGHLSNFLVCQAQFKVEEELAILLNELQKRLPAEEEVVKNALRIYDDRMNVAEKRAVLTAMVKTVYQIWRNSGPFVMSIFGVKMGENYPKEMAAMKRFYGTKSLQCLKAFPRVFVDGLDSKKINTIALSDEVLSIIDNEVHKEAVNEVVEVVDRLEIEQMGFTVAYLLDHGKTRVFVLDIESFNVLPESSLYVRRKFGSFDGFLKCNGALFDINADSVSLVAGMTREMAANILVIKNI